MPLAIGSWTQHIHQDDAERVMAGVSALLESHETNWKDEYRYRKPDSTFADVVDRGFMIRDEQGKAVRMVGAMHDISERKKGLAEAKRFTDELYKQNRELQHFGYIVSHNLRSRWPISLGSPTYGNGSGRPGDDCHWYQRFEDLRKPPGCGDHRHDENIKPE